MSGILSFALMTLQARRRRILALIAFAILFIAAGAVARVLTGGGHGHVEVEMIFEFGGSTLVSALLLLGWLVVRLPLIAALVLMQGAFSADRSAGYARLYAVRPRSLVALYGARYLALSLVAFALGAVVLPVFDLLILGEWPGYPMFVIIAAQVLLYGSVTALLSVVTRADAWATLFLAGIALVWDALRRMDFLATTPGVIREGISVLLPPQGALMRIEQAFAASQPVPWDAFLYITLYATLALTLAAAIIGRREI